MTPTKVQRQSICVFCSAWTEFSVEAKDWDEFCDDRPRHKMQDLFPYLTPGQRESLISGVCEVCFDNSCQDPEDQNRIESQPQCLLAQQQLDLHDFGPDALVQKGSWRQESDTVWSIPVVLTHEGRPRVRTYVVRFQSGDVHEGYFNSAG